MNQQEFEKFTEKYKEQIHLLAERSGISIEAFKESLRAIVLTVVPLVDNVTRIANNIMEFMQSLDLEKLESDSAERQRLYKLDLKRPIIRSQVIDRKSQHLIKKIIY